MAYALPLHFAGMEKLFTCWLFVIIGTIWFCFVPIFDNDVDSLTTHEKTEYGHAIHFIFI